LSTPTSKVDLFTYSNSNSDNNVLLMMKTHPDIKININYVCSLGSYCQSANFLKQNGLKKTSFPFDWVFSDTQIVYHCISDNFETMLNKNNYVDIATKWNNNQCGHSVYGGCFFNHRDMRKRENYEYLERCVERFKTLLKKQQNILFLIIFQNICNKKYCISEIVKIHNIICKNSDSVYNNNKYYIIINIIKNTSRKYNVEIYLNIILIDLYVLSNTDGSNFVDIEDNILLKEAIYSLHNFDIIDDIK
jgi:hypothetical protein